MFAAELWAQVWRNIPHSNQETAAAIESYHHVIKVLTPCMGRSHNSRYIYCCDMLIFIYLL